MIHQSIGGKKGGFCFKFLILFLKLNQIQKKFYSK